MDLLAAERDVIAIDLPGFGESDPLPGGTRHSALEMGRAVAAHLDSLGVERPHLVGNSLGAWTALEMAADGDAASVCCISPAGLWRDELGPRTYDSRRLGQRGRRLINVAMRTERGRKALLRTTVARPELLSSAEAISMAGGVARRTLLRRRERHDARHPVRARRRGATCRSRSPGARRTGWSLRPGPSGCPPARATSASPVGGTRRRATIPRALQASCSKPAP